MSSVLQESIAALKGARNIALLAAFRRNFSAAFSGPASTSQIEFGLAYALRFSQAMPTFLEA
jgi:hypothetical protein